VERGLDEAMQLLKVGDRAKLILPSHLAFGLVGDDNCVPRKAILIYDVQIIDFVKPTKIN
jgi:FKBP-type peptidyl-prolyl cis-trans isomerase